MHQTALFLSSVGRSVSEKESFRLRSLRMRAEERTNTYVKEEEEEDEVGEKGKGEERKLLRPLRREEKAEQACKWEKLTQERARSTT